MEVIVRDRTVIRHKDDGKSVQLAVSELQLEKQILLPLNYRLFQEQDRHQRGMAIDDNKVEVSLTIILIML